MRSVGLAFFRQCPARAVKALLVFLMFLAGGVYATNYSLWVNGRNNSAAQAGNYADFTYWGPASAAAGVNKKSVNWDGSSHVADQNYRIRDALSPTLFRFTDSVYASKGQVGFLAWQRSGGNLLDISGTSVKHLLQSAT